MALSCLNRQNKKQKKGGDAGWQGEREEKDGLEKAKDTQKQLRKAGERGREEGGKKCNATAYKAKKKITNCENY